MSGIHATAVVDPRAELDARGGNIEIDYAIEIDHALSQAKKRLNRRMAFPASSPQVQTTNA